MLILGIETTCDETAAAVVEDGTCVLSNVVASQIDLHQKFGGVVPEVAARAHLESLNAIVDKALADAHITDPASQLAAVAVANCPGLIGCLLVGTAAAKAYSFAWNLPLIAVNHVQAHLYSVVLRDSGQWSVVSGQNTEGQPTDHAPPFPAIGLVMSGGHSSLYHVRAFDQLRRIGQTQDDAVGEAFDKVAAILHLGYPGGPLIDQLAKHGDPNAIKFPAGHLDKDSLNFSFSGLKTAVLYHVNGKKGRERDASALTEKQKADVAASFQKTAATMLIEKLRRAAARSETRSLIIGGGVSANSAIRAAVTKLGHELHLPVFIPPMQFCTDNAAMIAGLAHPLLLANKTADLSMEAIATI
ncbi:MAG TPA: tRNA (adenosine(37)-N6)-threonylcarbamoyltransferase complex transferase subunit TsaD [Phycisphaerae bacterium]|nr:tRNA (adenosine(37)-N6)-threonylcarbamoyltransferase complex transferase subunit TsaD [Phycisphaerae bacterium]